MNNKKTTSGMLDATSLVGRVAERAWLTARLLGVTAVGNRKGRPPAAPADAPATFPYQLRKGAPQSSGWPEQSVTTQLVRAASEQADPEATWILARRVLATVRFCVPDADIRVVEAVAEDAVVRVLRERHADRSDSATLQLVTATVFETMTDPLVHPAMAALVAKELRPSVDVTPVATPESDLLEELLRRDGYGLDLIERVKNATGRVLPMSIVYPALRGMERDGLVRSYDDDSSSPDRGGRPRRYYQITAKGVEQVQKDAAKGAAQDDATLMKPRTSH